MTTATARTASADSAATESTSPDSAAVAEVAAPVTVQRRSNLIPAIVVAVGILGAAFLMSGGLGGGSSEPDEAAVEEIMPGEIVQLEPMTLNLTDGRYLRLGVAVELVEGVPAKEWVEHGGSTRYMDLIIDRVGERGGDQVATPEGRDELKALLREGGAELFEDEFSDIYVTELVVQ